ncbi:UvrD-like helicase, ATP-binding domain, P-loop containing nucleoside triphosphate hydrolase [Tanacetum coccineum]
MNTKGLPVALYKMQCFHGSSVEKIWGPSGTGKTMTLASRVLRLVRESFKITTASGDYFYPVGDVVLFGTKERLNVSTDIEEIFLEHRVKRLVECLGPMTGWKHCIRSMIHLLENYDSEYYSVSLNYIKSNKNVIGLRKSN